jgi:predicted Zn-dependent peptidase
MSNRFTQHSLENGLRLVIEEMPDVRSAAAGFLVMTGARNETSDLAGVSHFLEHMMFKGTTKRGWRDITIDFDKMGSTYNAYTSEDRTMYYGWVPKSEIGAQIELLADMLRSALPDEELQMERNVILEEIAMSKDHLEHVAMDFLQEKVFAGHPMAWPVLGYDRTVQEVTRAQMLAYFERRYSPSNMIMVVAGKVDPREIIGLAEKNCAAWSTGRHVENQTTPTMHTGVDKLQVDRFKQQLIALTFPSVSAAHPQSETAAATATILGGANSRFYWNIVQTGLSPSVGAAHYSYIDCGITLLWAACEPENCARLCDAMKHEADVICREPVQPHEVERVKMRRRTSLAVEGEAPYHRLTQIMDDMQYLGSPRTVEQMLADVDEVSCDSIAAYLKEYPINQGGHLASVGPRLWPENGKANGA